MGKINDKNLQYRLAFQDEDLKKPTHDVIMHWLDDWTKNPNNVAHFFKDNRKRTRNTYYSLNSVSKEQVEQSQLKSSIFQQFESDFRNKYLTVDRHDSEPTMSVNYVGRQWEALLHAYDENYSRKQFMGFCDLVATYDVTVETEHQTVHYKNLASIDPDPEYKQWKKWKFLDDETKSSYVNRNESMNLFFEVKSEIRSIGELMRQIQFYRTSTEVKQAFRTNGCGMVVVAPSNKEAEEVVRSHGFGFVEFQR